jgi:nicotinamide-nucleotide amidase
MAKALEELVNDLETYCLANKIKIATAESCTGGWLAHAIVSKPGSSKWYDGGAVSYSNELKESLLNVPMGVIEREGAVSQKVVELMAEGILQHCHADLGIAITGIAGPDGGTDDKPVGTVWFAWAQRNGGLYSETRHFQGDRQEVREQAVKVAISGCLNGLFD